MFIDISLALAFAIDIKAGNITRMCAIRLLQSIERLPFMDALLAIDIAIGDLNAGTVNEGIA